MSKKIKHDPKSFDLITNGSLRLNIQQTFQIVHFLEMC